MKRTVKIKGNSKLSETPNVSKRKKPTNYNNISTPAHI
jgi:hypothetical protein